MPDTTPPPVLVDRTGPLMRMTLNRPAKCNAITPEMAELIEAAIDELESDPELRVGVLRANVRDTAPVFCSGHDLKHFLAAFGTPEEHAVSTRRGGFAGLTERSRTKPVVAAVGGLASSGGWEMVLACDVVVASTEASFALAEVRWNLVASGGAGFRIPRAVGRYVAADLLMTGEPMDAGRAHQLGLVSRLVPSGELDACAEEVARTIAGNAPRAVRYSREMAERAEELDETTAWSLLLGRLAELRETADLQEGLRSFAERRPAVWTGD